SGARTTNELWHIYATPDTGTAPVFRYDYVRGALASSAMGTSSIFTFHGRVYIGLPDIDFTRPTYIVLRKMPSSPGSTPVIVADHQENARPRACRQGGSAHGGPRRQPLRSAKHDHGTSAVGLFTGSGPGVRSRRLEVARGERDRRHAIESVRRSAEHPHHAPRSDLRAAVRRLQQPGRPGALPVQGKRTRDANGLRGCRRMRC